MSADTSGKRPFSGLRILDFSRVLAGPFCTAMLADLGAEIIKVEPPGGDDQRAMGAFRNGRSVNFELINRNKRSLRLDLKQPAGRQLALRLAARCDVVVENFRPGVADRLGIDFAAIAAVRPDVIYCSISGFGQNGPLAQHPSYDVVAQAASGLMSLTGPKDGDPVLVGDSVGDTVSGTFAAFGIAAALYRRAITGIGGRIDIAMFDALFALLPTALAQLQATGRAPQRCGAVHPLSAPFGAYRASDRTFMLAIANNPLFGRFASVIGRPGLALEDRFASDRQRRDNEGALRTIIEDWAATRKASDIIALLLEAGIPASDIWTIDEAAGSAHARHRHLTTAVEAAGLGRIDLPEQPVHFADLERGGVRPAPALGADGPDILTALLDLTQVEISRLQADGAI